MPYRTSNLKTIISKLTTINKAVLEMGKLAWQAQPVVFVSLTTLQIIQGITPVLTAWILKQIFDLLVDIFRDNSSAEFVQSLLPLLAIQAAITFFTQALGQANTYLNAEMGRKLHLKTQSIMYRRIADLDGLAYFENPEFHDTMRMATHGLYSGPSQILQIFTSAIRSLITLFSFLGVLFFLSPILALIVIVASLPQLIAQLKIGRQRFGLMHINTPKERKAGYLGQVLSSLNFAKEIRLFNLSDYFLNQFLDTTIEVQSTQRKQQLREIRWQLGLGILSSAVSSAAFIIVVLQAFEGRITLGDVTLYTSALASIQAAFSSIIFSIANLNESVLFFTRFKDLMALPPSLYVTQSPRPVPPLIYGIEFKNVSFRYSENHPWVLRDVELFLPRGKTLALVGLNGAGKTTLVKLLTRFYDPTEGQILWDGIDIREFDVKELRQRMGAIFQDFVRYDLTAQENIGLGNVEDIENLERIQQAATSVKVHDFIETLPQGYQTVLSRWLVEDGFGADLSGGEWQKIATARMFTRDVDFLLLDEPTAALDAESEYEIYRHFTTLVKDRTSLLISHRFSTVHIADLIAVLEDGSITEYGTHQQLLADAKTYAKLYNMQIEQYTIHDALEINYA